MGTYGRLKLLEICLYNLIIKICPKNPKRLRNFGDIGFLGTEMILAHNREIA
jgi:hypothetical protein